MLLVILSVLHPDTLSSIPRPMSRVLRSSVGIGFTVCRVHRSYCSCCYLYLRDIRRNYFLFVVSSFCTNFANTLRYFSPPDGSLMVIRQSSGLGQWPSHFSLLRACENVIRSSPKCGHLWLSFDFTTIQ